jgi:hypothetical protein
MASKKSALAAAATLLATLVAAPAQAAVTYSFVALSSFDFDGETAVGAWSFTSPTFITSNTTVPVSELGTCVVVPTGGPGTCKAPSFKYHVNGPGDEDEVATLHFSSPLTTNTEIFYYFAPGSFEHIGTYDTVLFGTDQQGVLTVAAASAVPEPASGALLFAGLGLLGVAARRARRR